MSRVPSVGRRMFINTKGTILESFYVRGADHVRRARSRNRLAAILRHAKAIPIIEPTIHPVTLETIPLIRSICHSCGRQFFYRPRPQYYESNTRRKYCHSTCQKSRPFEFDRWLEGRIMRVLYQTHRINSGKFRFRSISTDGIEDYILRHRGKVFGNDLPLNLRERIRQAARRLIGIPGRSGKDWQVVALQKNTNPEVENGEKWIRSSYPPDQGNIVLGLVKVEVSKRVMKELSLAEAKGEIKSIEQQIAERKIYGKVLQDVPEWKGRFWWDETGKIRPIEDTRRKRYPGIIEKRRWGDDLLGTKWAATKQRLNLYNRKSKGSGWSELLRQNQNVVDALTAQRNKDFGLAE